VERGEVGAVGQLRPLYLDPIVALIQRLVLARLPLRPVIPVTVATGTGPLITLRPVPGTEVAPLTVTKGPATFAVTEAAALTLHVGLATFAITEVAALTLDVGLAALAITEAALTLLVRPTAFTISEGAPTFALAVGLATLATAEAAALTLGVRLATFTVAI